MKKLPIFLILLALAGGCAVSSQAAGRPVPDAFRGNWIDTTTRLWALSLQNDFAVLDASFWDYGTWNGKGRTATARLVRGDGDTRKLRLELLNDSTLVMREGKTRCVLRHESLATARLPFTAPPDTVPFRSVPWVNDSIRVEGFIVGYKPGDAVYHYWSPALFGFDNPNTPMNTDSLGRFSVSIPSTHEQIHIVGTNVAAGPGDRIFIAYSSEGERHLFMGDNARVNQELDAHYSGSVIRQFLPESDPNERIGDAMSWRFARLLARDMALRAADDYVRKHNLSAKTRQALRSYIKCTMIEEITTMLDKHPRLPWSYSYYLPDQSLDYSDPELFFCSVNYTLLPAFMPLRAGYEPLYAADRAGFRGDDRETFLNLGYFNYYNPERFHDFMSRNLHLLDSLRRILTFQTKLRWAAPVADTMVPAGGLNHDIVFAQGIAFPWSFFEEPLSDETLALIDSVLCGAPFLRDTLRGLNDRYRMLAERNAALEIPKGKIDSTLSQPDSILAAILRPYAGQAVCMISMEPGMPEFDKELRHIPTIREKYKNAAIRFILVSNGQAPLKWRNTIAEYGLIGEHTVHYELTSLQIQALQQKYWDGSGFFLLFDRSGRRVADTDDLRPLNAKTLLEKIDELLAR